MGTHAESVRRYCRHRRVVDELFENHKTALGKNVQRWDGIGEEEGKWERVYDCSFVFAGSIILRFLWRVDENEVRGCH